MNNSEKGTLNATIIKIIKENAKIAIEKFGTFEPYGILIIKENGKTTLMDLEPTDDSNEVLKGIPANQMTRKIEDLIRFNIKAHNVFCAALITDSEFRTQDGVETGNVVRAWIQEKGFQFNLVDIFYKIENDQFIELETVISVKPYTWFT